MMYMKIFEKRGKGEGNGKGDKLEKIECKAEGVDGESCKERLTNSVIELHSKIKVMRQMAMDGDISLPAKSVKE